MATPEPITKCDINGYIDKLGILGNIKVAGEITPSKSNGTLSALLRGVLTDAQWNLMTQMTTANLRSINLLSSSATFTILNVWFSNKSVYFDTNVGNGDDGSMPTLYQPISAFIDITESNSLVVK